jgi:hypothetical protein
MNDLLSVVLIGIGATLIMDIWGLLRQRLLGIAPANYGMVGRWIGHMLHGQFQHEAIAAAPRINGEHVIGWAAHYLIGVAFATLLIAVAGRSWMLAPSIAPAIAVGVATVVAPFFLMQPGMGAGIAASKTKNPASARVQSLITHSVFGLGLYLSGLVLSGLW